MAILDELFAPIGSCLTPDVAKSLAGLRAPAKVQARMEEFAQKSIEGTLTKEEKAEYDALVSAGNFIALLQAEARGVLAAETTG